MERCWVRHFGVPRTLWTDEGRGWCSDEFANWTTQNDVTHEVSPGEAHTRLSIVERRHQVLRKSVEVFLHDMSLTVDGIKRSLVYVLPQLNSHPSVAGFSPAQWVLGKQPALAGELLGEHVNPRHLQGDQAFEEVLHNRAMAKTAIIQAETDRKLRRALLFRWLGPARVLLREDDENGIPTMYWIGHKTQLLRCAPHHVRADFRGGVENALEEVEKAKVEVKELKSRGVTRYHDLNILNKASIDDVNTDEEFLEDDEEVQEPPRQRPRLTFEDDLPSTGLMDDDCDYSPTTIGAPENVPDPGGVGSGLGLEEPTLLQPPVDVANLPVPDTDDEHPEPPVMELDSPVGESTVDALLDETEPSQEPSAANTVVNTPTARQPSQPLPAPMVLDSITASYYEPVHVEDFASRRRRVDQQETMSVFGPARPRPPTRAHGPYAPAGGSDPPSGAAAPQPPVNSELMVMDLDPEGLPEGWYIDEHGYFQTTSTPCDWWEVRSGCLIRHHVVPRRNLYVLKKDPKCPVDLKCLDRIRVTMMKDAHGNIGQMHDCGDSAVQDWTSTTWTGVTIFQINGETRREMAMVVRQPYRSAGQMVWLDCRCLYNYLNPESYG